MKKHIKDLRPNVNAKSKQGYYQIQNPHKYVGNPQEIIFRSSIEFNFCKYCDFADSVLRWSSEPFSIPYWSPIDEKYHLYWVDFFVEIQKSDKIISCLVECKPESELKKPFLKESDSNTFQKIHSYNEKLRTFIVNKSKFAAAREFCSKNGYEFVIVSEKFFKP